jgi:cell division protein FtsI (penicillin-binding protein 3)
VLTIDQNVQWQVEYSLLDQVRATGAKGGMAAVVDVTNGDVVAMATVLGATGDEPPRVAGAGDRNAPLTQLFAPGSTAKLITLAWALEHGHVTPDTMFTVPYAKKMHPSMEKPFVDAEWHETAWWSAADILRHSSNIGTMLIAAKMGNRELFDGFRSFGIGQRTSIDWPGQEAGIVLQPDEYYATGKFTTAIGYGAASTGMQMLDAFVTIGNDGVSRPPRLLAATIDADGTHHPTDVLAGARVVSSGTARTMTEMMQGVVSNGTGVCAAIPGYPVAGKTGTSKKLEEETGEYSETSTYASFIGFAPADSPRFAALVALDEPAFQFQFGGQAAAPVWSEIMQFALTQYRVAPTDPTDAQFREAQEVARAAGASCSVPHGDALAEVVAQLGTAGARVPEPGEGAGAGRPQTDGG